MTSIVDTHEVHRSRLLRPSGKSGRTRGSLFGHALMVMALTVFGFGAAAGLRPATVEAKDGGLAAELVVVLGKSTPGPSDPKLSAYPALAGPQFAMFQSRSLLQQALLTLMPGKAVESKLPNGGKVTLTVKDRLPNGAVRLLVEVTKSDGKTRLAKLTAKLAPGVPFFIAGQQHDGGTLIMGVTLKKSGS